MDSKAPSPPQFPPQQIENKRQHMTPTDKKRGLRKYLLLTGLLLFVSIVAIAVATTVWYSQNLKPLRADGSSVKVVVQSGATPSQIADQLYEQGIIRNARVFEIYVRLNGKQGSLQAGSYRLSPTESVEELVEHLLKGATEEFVITFYPGGTLVDTVSTEPNKRDHRTMLLRAGYSEAEIQAAFSHQYDHPLFASKPQAQDVEGYIYGETYRIPVGWTAEQVLTRTFDEFYKVVQDNDLEKLFTDRGLTLYEGITLASIIQRESGGDDDKAMISQVFQTRLRIGMQLGSDVTYQYIADKLGIPRSTTLDNPYNTRRYTGLPPGPIASPGLKSLLAVASPADTNYLFFLSGDDNVTYFGRTQAEHEANIRNHCQQKCKII